MLLENANSKCSYYAHSFAPFRRKSYSRGRSSPYPSGAENNSSMHSQPENFNESLRVQLALIDNATWRPLNHWTFTNKELITIGRGSDQDVSVSDPVVSRSHAVLDFRFGTWHLKSCGRHGVLILDKLITEEEATSGMFFRLGPQGPTLKFSIGSELEDIRSTCNFEEMQQPLESDDEDEEYELDHEKLEREVNEIAESDYFQQLQRIAAEMRARRSQSDK